MTWTPGSWVQAYCRIDEVLARTPATTVTSPRPEIPCRADRSSGGFARRSTPRPATGSSRSDGSAIRGSSGSSLAQIDGRHVLTTWHPVGHWLGDDPELVHRSAVACAAVRAALPFDPGPPCDLVVVDDGRVLFDFALCRDPPVV